MKSKWNEIFTHWQASKVPDVEVIDFDIDKHYPSLSWFNKERNEQPVITSNPITDTARHLVKILPKKGAEFAAAYKILAYCEAADIPGAIRTECLKVLKNHEVNRYNLWSSQAKRVLPYWQDGGLDYPPIKTQWNIVIDNAASTWRDIADTYSVIEIPEWMDWGSPKRVKYEEHLARLLEDRERKEYERLKSKFE